MGRLKIRSIVSELPSLAQYIAMNIRYIKSATIVIECNDLKIMTDPWLVDGEYYGSWHHFPAVELDENYFSGIDYIYVSHIHPDHFSKETFRLLDKRIPVLIHKYESPFLRQNIERLGFEVLELPHNQRTHLKNGVHINILAADNCNPALCAKFFGCGIVETKFGSTQIDSLCVIDDGQYVVLNTNDCPYDLAEEALVEVKAQYKKIDFLLVGYGGAGPFPQCFIMPEEEMQKAAKRKAEQFLQHGLKYLAFIRPRYYMPFAGTYTLGGRLARLQKYRGVPEPEEARDYFKGSNLIDAAENQAVLLNSYQSFDLKSQRPSAPYQETDVVEKQRYIDEVLSKKLLDYELDPYPDPGSLLAMIEKAYARMEKKRKEIHFCSPTRVLLNVSGEEMVSISMNGEGYERIKNGGVSHLNGFVRYHIDLRLLNRILKGPRFAHWNNAEIGSHIIFERKPEVFERGLYHVMCFFHS
jgi:UDP-MurNAc hydroxylase